MACGSLWMSMASEARQQAQAEKLTLLVAENKTGYYGVCLRSQPGLAKPYQARVKRGGQQVCTWATSPPPRRRRCAWRVRRRGRQWRRSGLQRRRR